MEENVSSGQLDQSPSFDRKPMLTVDFQGRAQIKVKRKHKAELISEFIPGLNQNAERIAREIREEITNNLPHGLNVSLDISFSPGSVFWDGVAAVLDVAGKVVDGVDFTKLAISVIRFSINKIVRREIETKYPVTSLDTNITKRKIYDSEYLGTRFLWWCGGTSKDILRDSTFSEKARYVSMGGVVLTTGVLACMSGGYALYTVFESASYSVPIAIFSGLVWGLIIFNLDRYIMTSIKKVRESPGHPALRAELRTAWPRFIVALLLGITISVPLELRLFKPEIDSQLKFGETASMRRKDEEINQRYAPTRDDLNDQVRGINDEIARKEKQVNDLREAFYQEMDRRGGTRVYGYGAVARRKEAEFLKVEKERKDEIDKLLETRKNAQGKISHLDSLKKSELDEYQKTLGKGILARMTALSDLSRAHLIVFPISLFISLLFIFFEVAPVLVKLLSKFGPYDAKLELREEAEVERAKFKKIAAVRIAENHYTNLAVAEILVEEEFFSTSIIARQNELDSQFQSWIQQRARGQSVSFEEFRKSVEDSLYLERN